MVLLAIKPWSRQHHHSKLDLHIPLRPTHTHQEAKWNTPPPPTKTKTEKDKTVPVLSLSRTRRHDKMRRRPSRPSSSPS